MEGLQDYIRQNKNRFLIELFELLRIQSISADKKYSFKIYEDDTVLNMSYLEHNSRYSAWPGGGDDSCNYVNISKIQIELIE